MELVIDDERVEKMNDDDDDIEMFFNRLMEKQESRSNYKSISTYLSLRKPVRLDYQISTILDNLKHANTDEELYAYNKTMDLFDGVTSTFGFDARGKVQIIKEEYNAELLVNSLGSVDYVKEGRSGVIGDGWYEQGHFLFRLYIPPNAVRDIIEKVTIFDKSFTSRENQDIFDAMDMGSALFGDNIEGTEDERFLKIRLDLVIHDEIRDWGNSKKISYKIERLYM